MNEKEHRFTEAVLEQLRYVEGAHLRPTLLGTPERVRRAWDEMLDGYQVDIDALFRTFDGEGKDQVVVVKKIESWSLCEHHLLPFHISAAVGYLPAERVIGVSKVERLVHAFAHRLQLQERLTEQIASTLMERLHPRGVAVVLEGEHLCLKVRGVRSNSGKVVTSVMLGQFRDESSLRAEFFQLRGE